MAPRLPGHSSGEVFQGDGAGVRSGDGLVRGSEKADTRWGGLEWGQLVRWNVEPGFGRWGRLWGGLEISCWGEWIGYGEVGL